MAQRKSPCKGDWVNLVEEDLKSLNIDFNEEKIGNMTSEHFIAMVKKRVRDKAFAQLSAVQEGHIKVKHIEYTGLTGPQEYMYNASFNNRLTSLLYNLRCRTGKTLKDNFHRQYLGNISCIFNCFSEVDSQEHQLKCHTLKKHLSSEQAIMLDNVHYEDIFGSVEQQLRVTKVFQFLLRL